MEANDMAKYTFIGVLADNVKCAVCRVKDCPVKYYPGRKVTLWHESEKMTIGCAKNAAKKLSKMQKNKLP
jgi:hypothetical protein